MAGEELSGVQQCSATLSRPGRNPVWNDQSRRGRSLVMSRRIPGLLRQSHHGQLTIAQMAVNDLQVTNYQWSALCDAAAHIGSEIHPWNGTYLSEGHTRTEPRVSFSGRHLSVDSGGDIMI